MVGRPRSGVVRVCQLLSLVVIVAGCSSSDDGAAAGPLGGGGPDAATGTSTIGRAGGEIRNPDGSGLLVPPDAVPISATLEVTPYDGTLPRPPEGFALAGGAYAFTPHGQSFEEPVTIRVPYESSRLGKIVLWLEAPTDPKWGVLEEGPVYSMGIASIDVRSFSIYAVAHPSDGESIVCTDPLTACNGECVDTRSSNEHCGACRNRCDTSCDGSVCAPPPPMDCAEDTECDDGVFCNGVETCGGGLCVNNAAPTCDDGDPLTTDSCDDATQACVNMLADVDGGV